jgi:hypothetical protein
MARTGRPCKICTRADRQQIDAALTSGSALESVAQAFSLPLYSAQRHRANHVKAISEKTQATATATPAPSPIDPVKLSLRSPEDVLEQLEWAVAETKALLESAKAAGDLRLQDRLLQTALGALDKLAKSVGLYNDGTVVNVNTTTQRLELAVSKMTDEQLRALLAGNMVLPE